MCTYVGTYVHTYILRSPPTTVEEWRGGWTDDPLANSKCPFAVFDNAPHLTSPSTPCRPRLLPFPNQQKVPQHTPAAPYSLQALVSFAGACKFGTTCSCICHRPTVSRYLLAGRSSRGHLGIVCAISFLPGSPTSQSMQTFIHAPPIHQNAPSGSPQVFTRPPIALQLPAFPFLSLPPSPTHTTQHYHERTNPYHLYLLILLLLPTSCLLHLSCSFTSPSHYIIALFTFTIQDLQSRSSSRYRHLQSNRYR